MHELLTVIEGRNNRLSTLPDLWPTDGGVISSYYGGRTGPINGGFDWHPGLDIAVDIGARRCMPRPWEQWIWQAGTAGTGSL